MKFKYGKGVRNLELPPDAKIEKVEPKPLEPILDLEEALTASLDSPIGSVSLKDFAADKKKLTVIVPDKTRSAGITELIPLLMKYLKTWAKRDTEVSLLVANGMHLKATEDELDMLLTREVRKEYQVIQHDASDTSSMVMLGETSRGTPVQVNKIAGDADGLILTGSITFHYFAGFTGGRKAFLPGVASKESIVANHKLTVSGGKGKGGTSMTGILEGNPVHEDMIEAVRFAKPAFLVNTITNAEGRIAKFFCGDVEKAHRDGTRKVMEAFSTKLKRKADLVVAGCGGFPKDMNFIQAHKALHHAFQSVKEGGTLVLAAECSEGIGSETFLPYFQLADSGQIRESLMQEYTLNGHTALATLDKAERCNIVLLSELDGDVVTLMRMEPANGPEEVMEKATASLPEKSLVYVMPEAALMFVSHES